MSNINNIIKPVKNGQTRDSRLFVFDNKGYSDITISVISDRNLTLVLHQSYNELEFLQSEPVEYLAADGNKVFNFSKDGEIFFFTLTNTSGVDCTFTRAFADFTVSRTNINSTDTITHTKLDTLAAETETIKQFLQSDIVNVEDISVRDKLDTVNNNLSIIDNTLNNNVIDTCTKLCRPLQVKSVFVTNAGTTAINLLDGNIKLVSFIYAHSDNQGLLSFYDAAASSAAPTVNDTAYFLAPSTTNTLSCPSFPASSFINFNNGLWIRASSNIDPANSTSEAATITLFYET